MIWSRPASSARHLAEPKPYLHLAPESSFSPPLASQTPPTKVELQGSGEDHSPHRFKARSLREPAPTRPSLSLHRVTYGFFLELVDFSALRTCRPASTMRLLLFPKR